MTGDMWQVTHVTCHVSHVIIIIIFFFLPSPPPKKLSVLWSASVERFSVSRMRDFFLLLQLCLSFYLSYLDQSSEFKQDKNVLENNIKKAIWMQIQNILIYYRYLICHISAYIFVINVKKKENFFPWASHNFLEITVFV